jgi:hypothetical protein
MMMQKTYAVSMLDDQQGGETGQKMAKKNGRTPVSKFIFMAGDRNRIKASYFQAYPALSGGEHAS